MHGEESSRHPGSKLAESDGAAGRQHGEADGHVQQEVDQMEVPCRGAEEPALDRVAGEHERSVLAALPRPVPVTRGPGLEHPALDDARIPLHDRVIVEHDGHPERRQVRDQREERNQRGGGFPPPRSPRGARFTRSRLPIRSRLLAIGDASRERRARSARNSHEIA